MFREKIALRVAPLVIRLLLAVTFLWLGLGKILESVPMRGQDAADLAALGVIPLPQAPTDDAEAKAAQIPPEAPVVEPGALTEPVLVRRVHEVTLRISRAANPGEGKRSMWPAALGRGGWPAFLGWATAVLEVLGGFFVLIGLLTRVWAFVLAVIAAGAMWLMELGPTVRAELAPRAEVFDTGQWDGLMWKFALFMAALSLLISGPGPASIDRAIFRRGDDDDEA
jgi:uncharacterized membrane protein YphA (DoxX/SURF4 family)